MKNEITQKIEAFVSNAFNEEMKNNLKNGEADQDILLDYCLKKAWVDATLRERFHAGSSIIHNKVNVMMILKSELCHNNCILTNFSAWHSSLCKRTDFGMKYGIWQKFINMTFKYLLCCNRMAGYFPRFDPIWDKCHCPVDTIIAKRTLELLSSDTLSEETSFVLKSISQSGPVSWNHLNEEQYLIFQNQVKKICKKKEISPLEFDFLFWRS